MSFYYLQIYDNVEKDKTKSSVGFQALASSLWDSSKPYFSFDVLLRAFGLRSGDCEGHSS